MTQVCCDDCEYKDPLSTHGTSCWVGHSTLVTFDQTKGLHTYPQGIELCGKYLYSGDRPTRFEKILSDEHL
jgi:hypothetical protein